MTIEEELLTREDGTEWPKDNSGTYRYKTTRKTIRQLARAFPRNLLEPYVGELSQAMIAKKLDPEGDVTARDVAILFIYYGFDNPLRAPRGARPLDEVANAVRELLREDPQFRALVKELLEEII